MKDINKVNETYPIGSKVKYYVVTGLEQSAVTTTISSTAWKLGHGEIVIKVSGVTGCVSIENIKLL